MKLEIKELESDFELLHQFLVGEQVLLLHQLEERYESLLGRQSSNVRLLQEQSAALRRLLAEAEDKSRQDGLQLLQVCSARHPRGCHGGGVAGAAPVGDGMRTRALEEGSERLPRGMDVGEGIQRGEEEALRCEGNAQEVGNAPSLAGGTEPWVPGFSARWPCPRQGAGAG